MSGAQQRGEQPQSSTTENVTESISTEDSVEGVARELAGMRNVVDENVPADTDYYIYGANPLDDGYLRIMIMERNELELKVVTGCGIR